MSRIEEALKKAANQRSAPNEPEQANVFVHDVEMLDVSEPEGTDVNVGQLDKLLEVVPIKVEHLLLVTARDDKSDIVEEYNKIRSTIIALTKGEKFYNTLMVTSTLSEEGKSMTALNLAISLAKEHDHTVLLVDTDLRRPSIHKFLGIDPEVGLVHCLRDGLPIENALVKTGIGKLVVLPAGESVRDPVDMLSSNRMKEIILELKERYPERYVIFDTPPAMPFADAGVLASNIDATLYVVREGRAKKQEVVNTISELKNHNILGVVYNDAHSFTKKQSYYYYYR